MAYEKLTMYMKNPIEFSLFLLLFFLLTSFSNLCYSQTWSARLIISGADRCVNPDLAIDKYGGLHCVWVQVFGSDITRILYSKSLDNGSSWSNPIPISTNNDIWHGDPHIVADTNGNLYVTYDYDVGAWPDVKICYKKFDAVSQQWGPQIEIGTGYESRTTIDHNNRIYFFWFNGTEFFRSLEGNVLSDTMVLFYNPDVACFLHDISVDLSNNLHCIGNRTDGEHSKTAYFQYIDGEWMPFLDLSSKSSFVASIGLFSNNVPAFTWVQRIPESWLPTKGTYYAEYIADSVSSPLLLKDSTEYVSLAVDRNDCIHVVETEENDSAYQLVHRFKANGSWQSQIIEENSFYLSAIDLQAGTSCIHLVYGMTDTVGDFSSYTQFSRIFYRRLDIPPGIRSQNNHPGYIVFPNPFQRTITFKMQDGNSKIDGFAIFDMVGRLIYTAPKERFSGRDMQITWDGLTNSGKVAEDGFYILTVFLDSGIINVKIQKDN